ncbi:hypothetical protein DQ384_10945 [Sphaerisporangium album]|uniref:Uncharacterized protein n=1 Tax=Sphaerisporangium album TaxID=509200 RepID=A0A367FLU7_9ACTN|nr:hypothetical protein DQ384_10945 [Sphaerisporangium album]
MFATVPPSTTFIKGTTLAGLTLTALGLLLCAVAPPPANAAPSRPRHDRPSHDRDTDRSHRAAHRVVHRAVHRDDDRDSDAKGGDDKDADNGSEQKGGKSVHVTKIGNGSGNNSLLSVKSPTTNKGFQHTQAETISGSTSILNALCRHAKVCNITLNVIMAPPETAKKHTARKSASTGAPQAGNTASDEDDCCCDCESCDS